MNSILKLTIILVIIINLPLKSQGTDFSIKLNGYVNWTAVYDSRQTVAAREGHFLLYPKAEVLNTSGEDVNAASSFNMAVIQTRAGMKITGPDFLNSKTSGSLEAEFMGNANTDVNGFRLRHAYLKLEWENTSLLLGQTWNPMFVTEVYPYQIGSNGGAPFQPFARNPQIRLTHNINNYRFLFALLSERDYTSYGPAGSSGEYLRNAVLPDVHFQVQAKYGDHILGLGGEYKQLRPLLVTETNDVTDETISSYSFMGYGKFKSGDFTAAMEAIYGSNLASYTMLGGYAVKSINPLTKAQEYTPLNTLAIWSDLEFKSIVDFGLFAGYSKNLGADDIIVGSYYARGADIDNLLRIAPRISYTEGQVKFSFEVEYTAAGYGSPNNKGRVENSITVANTRIYTSVYYTF